MPQRQRSADLPGRQALRPPVRGADIASVPLCHEAEEGSRPDGYRREGRGGRKGRERVKKKEGRERKGESKREGGKVEGREMGWWDGRALAGSHTPTLTPKSLTNCACLYSSCVNCPKKS